MSRPKFPTKMSWDRGDRLWGHICDVEVPSGFPERKCRSFALLLRHSFSLWLCLGWQACCSGLAGRVSGAERLLSWGWGYYLNCLFLKQDFPCLGPSSAGWGLCCPCDFWGRFLTLESCALCLYGCHSQPCIAQKAIQT